MSRARRASENVSITSSVRLRNGVRMPIFGLGCSHRGGELNPRVVQEAYKAGVRLFDTAARYGTERPLRDALGRREIKESFITTKLWPTDATSVRDAFERSRKNLGVEVVDLYLVHWPGAWGTSGFDSNGAYRCHCWREMELLLDSGRVRSIGVSNFLPRHFESLEDAGECANVLPFVNQLELNPLQHNTGVVAYCRKRSIVVEGTCPPQHQGFRSYSRSSVSSFVRFRSSGWAPLGKGHVLCDDRILHMAKRLRRSPSTLALRWALQHQFVTIPKTTSVDHFRSNLDCFEFSLSDQDMAALDRMHRNLRVSWDPDDID